MAWPALTAGLALAPLAAVLGLAGDEGPAVPRLEVTVGQRVAFDEARFVVTLAPPARMKGTPTVRPLYGSAQVVPDSVTETGFAFLWDVAGAIRSARGELLGTRIHLHWTLRAEPPQREALMLTVVNVALSPTGNVSITGTTTTPPADWRGAAATQPAAPAAGGQATAAVTRIQTDEQGRFVFGLRLFGDVALSGEPRVMVNVGRAEVRLVAGSTNRLDLTWRRPDRPGEGPVAVTASVAWTGRTARGALIAGTTVVEALVEGAEAGVTGLRTTTNLVPPG